MKKNFRARFDTYRIVFLMSFVCFPLSASATSPLPILHATAVPLAEDLRIGDHVEKIKFLGMLMLPSIHVNDLRFAQLSGLAWDEDEGILYAISDKGVLFHLEPVFHDDVLVDVTLRAAVLLISPKTNRPALGVYADTEGLDILNGHNGRRGDTELLVSFERFPRILRYRPDGHPIGEYQLPLPLKNRDNFRSSNKMLEAVCVDPTLGVLTMPESPLAAEPDELNRIYSTSGESWVYPMENENRIVAMECLGAGEVIVLERDYGRLLWRSLISLKRTRLPIVPSTAPVPVETLVTMDTRRGFQIDNFEGLARHHGNRFFLISDDNDMFFQHTLLLYIEILKE